MPHGAKGEPARGWRTRDVLGVDDALMGARPRRARDARHGVVTGRSAGPVGASSMLSAFLPSVFFLTPPIKRFAPRSGHFTGILTPLLVVLSKLQHYCICTVHAFRRHSPPEVSNYALVTTSFFCVLNQREESGRLATLRRRYVSKSTRSPSHAVSSTTRSTPHGNVGLLRSRS